FRHVRPVRCMSNCTQPASTVAMRFRQGQDSCTARLCGPRFPSTIAPHVRAVRSRGKGQMQPQSEAFDAIVVGSGISGGWAAKELTERGLRVLMLERGKDIEHIKD